jgi:hypothetical protein
MFYVLKVTNRTPEIVAMSETEGAALAMHTKLDDERVADGVPMTDTYYAVRELDSHDGLVRSALDAIKLSPKQREALLQLDHATRVPYPRAWVRPGRERSWAGMYSGDLVAPARKLAERRLVIVKGVAYGPKSYRVTRLGRVLAEHLRERVATN